MAPLLVVRVQYLRDLDTGEKLTQRERLHKIASKVGLNLPETVE